MPLYEYHCAGCGERIELLRGFNQPPLTECPKCGGVLTKLISAPAIQFKGSGFYLTDYGRGGVGPKSDAAAGKSEGGGDKAAASESKASGDGTPAADSKPASESKPAANSKPAAESKPAKTP